MTHLRSEPGVSHGMVAVPFVPSKKLLALKSDVGVRRVQQKSAGQEIESLVAICAAVVVVVLPCC